MVMVDDDTCLLGGWLVALWIFYVFVLLLYILGRIPWSWYRDDAGSMDSSIMTDYSSLYLLAS